jgi:hypothetical protein
VCAVKAEEWSFKSLPFSPFLFVWQFSPRHSTGIVGEKVRREKALDFSG